MPGQQQHPSTVQNQQQPSTGAQSYLPGSANNMLNRQPNVATSMYGNPYNPYAMAMNPGVGMQYAHASQMALMVQRQRSMQMQQQVMQQAAAQHGGHNPYGHMASPNVNMSASARMSNMANNVQRAGAQQQQQNNAQGRNMQPQRNGNSEN